MGLPVARVLCVGWMFVGWVAWTGAAKAAQPPSAPAAPPSLPVFEGDDVPAPFTPLAPRTVEDLHKVDAIKAYTAARSLEDRGSITAAIRLLEQAQKLDPDSVAISRRLARLNFAQGRIDEAIKFSRLAIDADPNDSGTIAELFEYYSRKRDFQGAETLLKGVLANPKLNKGSAGYLLIQRDLGLLYALRLRKMDDAADALAVLVERLDDKAANQLTPADLRRVLGDAPDEAYLNFGLILSEAKRYKEAIHAFRRGLDYNPDNVAIPLRLAEALLKGGLPEEALTIIERYIKQQPQGREGYVLLGQILTALNRKDDYLPRLETAAAADSRNVGLQLALADAYRAAGQVEKAKALYQKLLTIRPDAQGYSALAGILTTEKKTEELLKVLVASLANPANINAIKPRIDALSEDPAYADEVLDTGLKMIKAVPPQLDPRAGQVVLVEVATKAKKTDKLLELLRFGFQRDPNPQTYLELYAGLADAGKYEEAGSTLEQLLAKFPQTRTSRLVAELARIRMLAGKIEPALEAAREALKLDPANGDIARIAAVLLSQADKADEALEVARTALKRDSENPQLQTLVGQILSQSGKDEEAIVHFQKLLEQFPNDDELVRLARSQLSILFVNRDDFARGERELEMLLEKYPEDIGVFNDLGYLYADQGKNLEKAEQMIRKAVEGDPENGAYLDSLGWVLFKRGKIKEAVEPLEKAAKALGTVDATITDHLGDVYFRLRDYSKARSAWEKAAEAADKAKPKDKRLPEIRKKLESLKALEKNPRPATGDNP